MKRVYEVVRIFYHSLVIYHYQEENKTHKLHYKCFFTCSEFDGKITHNCLSFGDIEVGNSFIFCKISGDFLNSTGEESSLLTILYIYICMYV